MKFAIVLLVAVAVCSASDISKSRQKRSYLAYRFADGVEYVVPEIRESFSCVNREYGYYADVGNNCQIFHVCVPPGQQFSFFCPNTTIFDQRLLICQDQYAATPCQDAERYYIINQNFGVRPGEEDKLEYLDNNSNSNSHNSNANPNTNNNPYARYSSSTSSSSSSSISSASVRASASSVYPGSVGVSVSSSAPVATTYPVTNPTYPSINTNTNPSYPATPVNRRGGGGETGPRANP